MYRRVMYRGLMAVVLVAVAVTLASSIMTPTYEASAQVLVAFQGQSDEPRPIPKRFLAPQQLAQRMVVATRSRPVAEEAIRRLELDTSPDELLGNLTVEQVENTSFIVLSYEDTDPERAELIVNTVGNVSSELISERSSKFTAAVYEKAALPESPVSPHPLRNGLLTLVIGLVLCAVYLVRMGQRGS
jgi:capsular polysaccharide biosynthesis protein